MELDWTIGTIRIGGDFKGAQPNTSYDFVCSVYLRGTECYLYAAHGSLDRKTYQLIKTRLQAMGIERITYERLNTDQLRTREIKTA